MTASLIGQNLGNGTNFGTTGGDFNYFPSAETPPSGSGPFMLRTHYGTGDQMLLTSFKSATSPVPEPSTYALMGIGGLLLAYRLKKSGKGSPVSV